MGKKILKLLPQKLKDFIEEQPDLKKIITNTGWLFGDKVFRMGGALIVGVWMARYLGPADYGILSFSIAFVSLFGAVFHLGLNKIIVRDVVQLASKKYKILGSSIFLRIMSGIITVGVVVLLIKLLRPDDKLTQLIVAIIVLGHFFQFTDVFKYWFESQVSSKYTVWVVNSAFLIVAVTKVVLILSEASIVAFAYAISAQIFLAGIGLTFVYWLKNRDLLKWEVKKSTCKYLLKESWPLIFSGVAIMIYMRFDEFMLGQMIDNEAVGIYSAAVKISEVWYFIAISISSSVFPSLVKLKNKNHQQYINRLKHLFKLMVYTSVSIAVIITFMSDWLVITLYGAEYSESGTILMIHIWAGVFMFLYKSSNCWFLIEDLQMYMMYRTLLGAIANIILNIFLIPYYGGVGAAIATVISLAIAGLFANLINSKTRPLFKMQIKAFLPSLKGN